MDSITSEQLIVKLGKKQILHSVSMEAKKGEFIGFIGPNGSGKSTWLKALSGLIKYESGNVLIENIPITQYNSKDLARIIGYVPQNTSIHFDFRVFDVVMMGRHPHIPRFSFERTEDFKKVEDVMEKMNISHLADQYVTNLSGGQRQMVFIAKALAQEPSILLLDEPISALDLNRQLQVLELVKNLVENEELIAIAALHDLNLAARFCHKLVLLKEGKVLISGTPEEVLTEERIRDSYHVEAIIRYDEILQATTVIPITFK